MAKRISSVNLGILTLAMAYVGWLSLGSAQQKWSSSSWLTVRGQIQDSHVASGKGNSRFAKVEYAYVVGSTSYRNDRMTFGDGVPPGYTDADDFVRQHPPGKEVEVHYDPRQPARSSLSRAGSVGKNLILALVCWGIASGCLYSVFRKRDDS